MRYDTDFDPPAPIIRLVLHNPQTRTGPYECRAMFDTGAGISVIPQAAVDHLQVVEAQRLKAKGWDGSVRIVPTYLVQMGVASNMIPVVEVVAAERPLALLGRDVLNQLQLLLNGPALIFEILPPT